LLAALARTQEHETTILGELRSIYFWALAVP